VLGLGAGIPMSYLQYQTRRNFECVFLGAPFALEDDVSHDVEGVGAAQATKVGEGHRCSDHQCLVSYRNYAVLALYKNPQLPIAGSLSSICARSGAFDHLFAVRSTLPTRQKYLTLYFLFPSLYNNVLVLILVLIDIT